MQYADDRRNGFDRGGRRNGPVAKPPQPFHSQTLQANTRDYTIYTGKIF